jgi:beta-galactosidase/beta-glucuronidase
MHDRGAPCSLHRDVFLLSKPATHISDFVVRTPLTFNDQDELQAARCAGRSRSS